MTRTLSGCTLRTFKRVLHRCCIYLHEAAVPQPRYSAGGLSLPG